MLISAVGSSLNRKNQVNFAATSNSKRKSSNNATNIVYDEKQTEKDIKKALQVLGNKKLELILHNASAPSYN